MTTDPTSDLPGKDATPLDPIEQARWDAAVGAIAAIGRKVAAGDVSEDEIVATANQLDQIPIEPERILDALHVPEDAGEYAEGLERILRRIPDGWGRWIGCGPGWYPLIVELDRELAALDPAYRVHQVKEKFGTLRYYFSPSPEAPLECCAPYLTAVANHEDGAFDAYLQHCDTEEHKTTDAAREPVRQARSVVAHQMRQIVDRYERLSAEICEETGTPGVLMVRNGWYRTLNPEIAPEGFEPVSQHD